MVVWPNGKKFAFTIVDDTDNSMLFNIKPVYDYLIKKGFRTTKTVWVYPPRDNFSGQSLQDEDYRKFIYDIKDKGFEIALHNVGSGEFKRKEILAGINEFHEIMGFYPKMQINHASNPDNIYWGVERYGQPLRGIMKLFYRDKRNYFGTDLSSEHFWGDIFKRHFKYARNHTFNGINTLRYDPKMPYRVKNKDEYSNYWFSSSDGHTVKEFNNLVQPENILRLENEGGLCIVYTHFASGFTDKSGSLNSVFKKNIDFLANKKGWFAPVSEILDYLNENKTQQNKDSFVNNKYLCRLDFLWLLNRVVKKIRFRR